MNIKVKRLGPLDQADLSLGDFTIICGDNNTGKTYATYALFGFLSFWREGFSVNVPRSTINQLLDEGTVHIDLREYSRKYDDIISSGCKQYNGRMAHVFAASEERFENTEFQIQINRDDISTEGHFDRTMKAAKADLFMIKKQAGDNILTVTLLVEKKKFGIPLESVQSIIGNAISEVLFGRLFPKPFIVSAERTGAAIFRKELNFARNRLLEEMSQADKKFNPLDLLFKVHQDYALPVERNVDFTRDLESVAKQTSFLQKEHKELLSQFGDIIGGRYTVTQEDQLYYVPRRGRVKLTMDESSSAVRSLLDLGFYLRHVARPGDLLMIDEPELNLHPNNQRRIARLLARLVNTGIKVFVTTHSDYIIKELNTLIMLSRDDKRMKTIAEREGYNQDEFLSAEKIKVFVAERAKILKEGNKRRSEAQTLVQAKVDQNCGIEAHSFDKTIDDMNRIQDEIIWGE